MDVADPTSSPQSAPTTCCTERVDDSALEARLASGQFDLTKVEDLRHWWYVRMAATRRPLVEKTALFWHGLLTTSYCKVNNGKVPNELMYAQNQFFRSHGLGKFRDILIGITKDGAMLKWLDGTGSSRAHPNENYARELMELFTMGVGHYSEIDVREAARALTGWAVDNTGAVTFKAKAHDASSKTFLGKTGDFGVLAA